MSNWGTIAVVPHGLSASTPADELICAVLRGEPAAWPWEDQEPAVADFQARADYQGVNALLHRSRACRAWPAAVVEQLHARALRQAVWEMGHQQVLAHALNSLAAAGLRPVLIKGTALAYSLYPGADMRTRGDTDLLIAPASREQADGILGSLGFKRALGVSGDYVSYQASYTRELAGRQLHVLDLHWKISNSQLLSRLFTYEELLRDARPLSRLSPDALGASDVHALLLACMHRCTHRQNPYYVNGVAHYSGDRLIWLYDIHLLAGRLTREEWDTCLRIADSKGLRAVCLESIELASACFATRLPDEVLAQWRGPGPVEAPARYLAGGKARQFRMDFHALGSWRNRLGFARELFFPPAAYMRGKYAGGPAACLPWLYLRRAFGGLRKGLAGNRPAS